MVKIIRKDFSVQDFENSVRHFLYADTKISLPQESLKTVEEHLLKAGPSLAKVFIPYFEKTDNTRYDDLVKKMESFVKKLLKYNADLQGEERKAFLLFWNEVAEAISTDYQTIQDSYLANSCKYFVGEIGKLS